MTRLKGILSVVIRLLVTFFLILGSHTILFSYPQFGVIISSAATIVLLDTLLYSATNTYRELFGLQICYWLLFAIFAVSILYLPFFIGIIAIDTVLMITFEKLLYKNESNDFDSFIIPGLIGYGDYPLTLSEKVSSEPRYITVLLPIFLIVSIVTQIIKSGASTTLYYVTDYIQFGQATIRYSVLPFDFAIQLGRENVTWTYLYFSVSGFFLPLALILWFVWTHISTIRENAISLAWTFIPSLVILILCSRGRRYGIITDWFSLSLLLVTSGFFFLFISRSDFEKMIATMCFWVVSITLLADMSFLLISELPYSGQIVFGGFGFAGFVWQNTLVILVWSLILYVLNPPVLNQSIIHPKNVPKSIRNFLKWFDSKPTSIKVVTLVTLFLVFSSFALGVSTSPIRTYGRYNGDWGTETVSGLLISGSYLVVGSGSHVYYVYPFTHYSYSIDVDAYISDMVCERNVLAVNAASNLSSVFIAANDYQASLKEILPNLTIIDLPLHPLAENYTFTKLAFSETTNVLYCFENHNGSIWFYNTTSSEMIVLDSNLGFGNPGTYLTSLEAIGGYLMIGTSNNGFWLYNEESKDWIRPNDEIGQITGVNGFELSRDGLSLYVASQHGLLVYSLMEGDLESEQVISPADGLPDLLVTSVLLDDSLESLFIGTLGGVAQYHYKTTGLVELLEETLPLEPYENYNYFIAYWTRGVHNLLMINPYGELFCLSIDYGRMNLSYWDFLNSLRANFITIILSASSSIALTWATLIRKNVKDKGEESET